MKFYNIKLNIQNFGSVLLVILRGSIKDINESYNSFYNLCGANGGIEIEDNNSFAVGIFWTNDVSLRRYWNNRFLAMNPQIRYKTVHSGKCEDANLYVECQMKEMLANQETFIDYSQNFEVQEMGFGKISAEAPDLSFKDHVYVHVSTQTIAPPNE